MFERYDQKLVVFVFYGRFHELLPRVLRFQDDLHVWESWPSNRRFRVLWSFSWVIAHIFGVPGRFNMTARHDTCLRAWSKTCHFCFLWPFSWAIAHSLGFQGDLQVWELWPKTRRFCVLWPFSWVIAHNIGVPGRFKMTGRPDTCLRVMTKNSSYSCFMAIFMRNCP